MREITAKQTAAELGSYLGTWNDAVAAEHEDSPEFFRRFAAMADVPRRRAALSPVDQALIGVAVVANTANTNWPRFDAYVRTALERGATRGQVRDVLQLVSIMSIHAMTVGVPALRRVLEERGHAVGHEPDERRARLRAEFERRRGYWHETWDDMLALDPEMFEAYTHFSTVVAEHGSLDTRLRELIYIAIDCVVTHLYVPGVEIHARNALDAGATPDQILGAMEIAVLTGADPYFEAIQRPTGLPAAERPGG
ncbi:carboxymuconolactone decarboxylase family protein [Streptomyces hygroscopicus]|uniref:carboxymuconolactone decarboxylase family protein n=1 Tax=Streptomyces hygroscopicus TaxID=1912 RepID=UPI003683ADA7